MLRHPACADAPSASAARGKINGRSAWTTLPGFFLVIGPALEAAVAHGFERGDLLDVLEATIDGDADRLLARLADEFADRIEAAR